MAGFAGMLPKARGPTKPTRIATFDIETIGWLEPYAAGFYDGTEFKHFEGSDCIEQFLDEFIRKKYRGTVVFAHNGGKFDFVHLIAVMRESKRWQSYEIRPLRLQGCFVQVDIIKDKHKWTLRDSYKLMPFALKAIGKKFGLAQHKGDFDHRKVTWANYESLREEWLPYLKLDCTVLYDALRTQEDYLRTRYGVTLKRNITLPSVARDIFQRNFLSGPVPNHRAVEEEIRKSYKGARVEIFKQRITNANYYDINSLYPYVMRKYPYPSGTPVRTERMRLNDFGIAFATVECPPDLKIPVLPHREGGKGKLLFPTGKFSDFYTTAELQLAHEKGYRITMHHGYVFPKAHLFREYVDEMYAVKERAAPDSVDYTMSKLNMNSLYGKFGQKRERKKIIINPTEVIGLTEVRPDKPELALFEQDVTSESGTILPAIASFVTSYARIELYRLLDGNDPVYCDTDSIITCSTLPTGSAIGELKREAEIAEGIFWLPKLYGMKLNYPHMLAWAFDETQPVVVKSKGFPKGTITYDALDRASVSGDASALSYTRDGFATALEALRRTGNWLAVIAHQRSVRATYTKRQLIGHNDSIPVCIIEEQASINT